MHPKHHMEYCPKCAAKQFDFKEFGAFECGSCGFQLFINASAAVAVFIMDQQGRLLLTRRKFDPMAGTLDLPGGFVDPMEKGEDACRREIQEELNLSLDELSYIGSFPNEYVYKGMSYYTLDLAYTAVVNDFTPLKVADDVAEALFLYPEEIKLEEIGLGSIKVMLQEFMIQNKRP
ncbi:NUDIX hydrolase [Algivirga pacifica]|uniref:NUDIX domain-containing protein n=1 Tax=Algivirga pacifica TaxID=1162670 RepID=A0ABP9CZR1_9BACT